MANSNPTYNTRQANHDQFYEQYPEELGGTWCPAVYGCTGYQSSLKVPNSDAPPLGPENEYITITWNFGAYAGHYATKLDDVASGKTGGVGGWGK